MATGNHRVITLENIGPLRRLVLPMPEEGGVVVLRGRNGVGKSHALEAIDTLLSGRGRPPVADGADRAVVEGFGARITIGKAIRRIGQAEVISLEGRFDLGDFVDPGIKDEESADRARIKALIQLSGLPADPAVFKEILPSSVELDQLLPPEERSQDPVELAGQIKRALEAEARQAENALETIRAEICALQKQLPPAWVPETEVKDWHIAEAQQRYIAAQREEAALRVKAEQIEARRKQAEKSAKVLETLRPNLQPLDQLQAEEANLLAQIDKLEKALAVAKERLTTVRRRIHEAKEIAKQIETLEAIVREAPEPIPPEALEEAARKVQQAWTRWEHLQQEQARQYTAGQIAKLQSVAEQAAAKAHALRDAAGAAEDVLCRLVSRVTKRLQVLHGRLVLPTHRGLERFSELSPGERWKLALQIAAECLGPGGVVVAQQEAWEGLDPLARQEVIDLAHRCRVIVYTAEAGEEEEITVQVQ